MAGGVPDRLRELRERLRPKVSRRELGERLGFSGRSAEQTVYEWETGRRGVPADLVPAIARALGVTPADVYADNLVVASRGRYEVVENPQPSQRSPSDDQLTYLISQLRRALELGPERIEINIYVSNRSATEPLPATDAGPHGIEEEIRTRMRALAQAAGELAARLDRG